MGDHQSEDQEDQEHQRLWKLLCTSFRVTALAASYLIIHLYAP